MTDKITIDLRGMRPKIKKWAIKEKVVKGSGEPHMGDYCRQLIEEGLARRESPQTQEQEPQTA